MAITIKSLAQVVATTAAAFRARFPTKAHDQDSYFGTLSRVLGMAILNFLKSARIISKDAVPSLENTDAGADTWGFALGAPSNNPTARYGRNIAEPASGGIGTITGTPATNVPSGTQLVDSTGRVTFATSGAVTVGGGGTVSVNIIAVTAGASGNLSAGAVLTFISPPAGIQAQVPLTTGLGGGLDIELTSSLNARNLRESQSPKRGGSAADFRRWCENYLDPQGIMPGLVKRTYIYPLRGGVGTVHGVIVGGGSGDARLLTGPIAVDVKAYVDTVRCVTAQFKALLPDMSTPAAITVSAAVVASPQQKYQYDWVDGSGNFIVQAVPSATQITINDNLATSVALSAVALKAAIDAYKNGAASAPRLQITALSSVLPLIVQATDYTNAANSVITLLAAPSSPISVADSVWAGGAVVIPVAQGILDLCDNLGPSRQSGYADEFDGWDDTMRIGAIEGVAITTVDPLDGRTRMVIDVTEVLINGGTTNVRAMDNIIAGTPQLLKLAHRGLIVRQKI